MSDYLGDEYVLYAETKQVNQFFRRFNAEELPNGKRLYPKDSLYHKKALRNEYLEMVFDQQSIDIRKDLKSQFLGEMLSATEQTYLDFHGGDWFAEVLTTFTYKGKEEKMLLFLSLEKAKIGSKWVFSGIYFEPFRKIFRQDSTPPSPPFIHPLSHELDFMNLMKVFRNGGKLEAYTSKSYEPDYLTLFLYEIKKKNLTFRSVDRVSFHFLQLDGWYFELSEVTREGPNRGWLITQLSQVPPGQKDRLLNFIYRR
ncbi:MAG: hypothetical protein MRZ79_25680 [Bacteroidia bacterium]|nr:hypothetical protein [Bacteroidia bacterium]